MNIILLKLFKRKLKIKPPILLMSTISTIVVATIHEITVKWHCHLAEDTHVDYSIYIENIPTTYTIFQCGENSFRKHWQRKQYVYEFKENVSFVFELCTYQTTV